MTFASGARQLVVQEALEISLCSGFRMIVVYTEHHQGIDLVLRGHRQNAPYLLRPARCFSRLARSRKMPVDSTTYSAPRSFQGSCAGSLSVVILMFWPGDN